MMFFEVSIPESSYYIAANTCFFVLQTPSDACPASPMAYQTSLDARPAPLDACPALLDACPTRLASYPTSLDAHPASSDACHAPPAVCPTQLASYPTSLDAHPALLDACPTRLTVYPALLAAYLTDTFVGFARQIVIQTLFVLFLTPLFKMKSVVFTVHRSVFKKLGFVKARNSFVISQ